MIRRDPWEVHTSPLSWSSTHANHHGPPPAGAVIGLWYAAWRVREVRILQPYDHRADDVAALAKLQPEHREPNWPYGVHLEFVSGPILDDLPLRLKTLHDGTVVTTVGVNAPSAGYRWWLLGDRYPVCSCHGHPWPCLDHNRDKVAKMQANALNREMHLAQAGVCSGCGEPFGPRTRILTFPEPSLTVPGAPPPTYHAARGSCWWSARTYEIEKRLPALPDAERVASCPGHVFTHVVGLREDCTAGTDCTGLHGPGRARHGTCYTRVYDALDLADGYPRPLTDCGYREVLEGGHQLSCLGAETGPREPVPPGIADLLGG